MTLTIRCSTKARTSDTTKQDASNQKRKRKTTTEQGEKASAKRIQRGT